MKKILVPCDFMTPATEAFKFAATIARQSKGEVILLYVVELPVLRHGPVPINAMEKVFLNGIKEQVEKDFIRMVEKWAKKIKVSLLVEHGRVNQTILHTIKRKKIDLVVMGTHGTSGVRELTLGSNTQKVIRYSPVPVLSIKKGFRGGIKNIVLATDLSPLPNKVTEKLLALQKFFKARLHIVYVNTPFNFKAEDTLHALLNDFIVQSGLHKNSDAHLYSDYDMVAGIQNFAKQNKADIIAVPTHSRKGLAHFIFGSVAEDVTNHIECPIWTLSTEG